MKFPNLSQSNLNYRVKRNDNIPISFPKNAIKSDSKDFANILIKTKEINAPKNVTPKEFFTNLSNEIIQEEKQKLEISAKNYFFNPPEQEQFKELSMDEGKRNLNKISRRNLTIGKRNKLSPIKINDQNNNFNELKIKAAKENTNHSKTIDLLIEERAKSLNMDPDLVRAVVKAESNFNPKAVSAVGAMGLMQLMPGTAQDMGVKQPFDPKSNLEGGIKYLKMMLTRYQGNLNKALAAYNWGPGNLDRYGANGRLPKETKNYISSVNNYYKQFANLSDKQEPKGYFASLNKDNA